MKACEIVGIVWLIDLILRDFICTFLISIIGWWWYFLYLKLVLLWTTAIQMHRSRNMTLQNMYEYVTYDM